MSLMEFCEIQKGQFVPTYKKQLVSIRCDWCDRSIEPVMAFGACGSVRLASKRPNGSGNGGKGDAKKGEAPEPEKKRCDD